MHIKKTQFFYEPCSKKFKQSAICPFFSHSFNDTASTENQSTFCLYFFFTKTKFLQEFQSKYLSQYLPTHKVRINRKLCPIIILKVKIQIPVPWVCKVWFRCSLYEVLGYTDRGKYKYINHGVTSSQTDFFQTTLPTKFCNFLSLVKRSLFIFLKRELQ